MDMTRDLNSKESCMLDMKNGDQPYKMPCSLADQRCTSTELEHAVADISNIMGARNQNRDAAVLFQQGIIY